MDDVPINSTSSVRAYTPTMELRWLRPEHTTTDRDRLQQKWLWRSEHSGGVEWRDVPLEIDTALTAPA